MNKNKDVSAYINQAAESQIFMLEKLRELVHNAVSGTTEAIKWEFPVFTHKKDYAYIRASKKHITLGFYHPEKIDDPDNLLEGSGSQLRHIKITTDKDINELQVTAWLKAVAE